MSIPQTRFAADFIGVMNFLPVRRDGTAFVTADGTRLASSRAADLPEGAAAVAAIRPERLRVGEGGENRLSGQVSDIAYHGLDLLVHVTTAATETPIITRMTADAAEQHRPAKGQPITLSWFAKDTHIFPA